jgi:hypothetical protein
MLLLRNEIEKLIPADGAAFDVIVAGGGPAGIGAAVASAISGAKTLLLEDRAFFGGVASVSGWMPMNRLLLNGKSRGDAVNLFVEKIYSFGKDAWREGKVSWVDGDGLHVHPAYLRLAVMELMQDTGCSFLLHSPVTNVTMEEDRITSVVCDGKYGCRTYSAKVYIDATGDGDLAFHAGVPFHKGRENDGVFMPVTVGFVLSNVDEEKLFAALDAEGHSSYISKIYENSKPGDATSVFYSFDKTTIPGTISVNNGGVKDIGIIDATKIEDVNISLQTGLQVAVDFVRIVREAKLPGLENCTLACTGADLGIRETRRIEGEYTLTLEDAQQGKEFDDVVARRYGTIDPGGLKEDKDYHNTIVNGHAYPYRCMLPKKVNPLLVVGRCASLTHLGLTVCKSMGNMMAIGQSAGVAAALCAKDHVTPRQIDIAKLQQRLREMGVKL